VDGAGGGGAWAARAALAWSGAVVQAARGGGCGLCGRRAVVVARSGGVQASAGEIVGEWLRERRRRGIGK
jgi:hypothetical protein